MSISYSSSHYAFFSILLLLFPSYVLSSPSYYMPTIYVLPLKSEIKCSHKYKMTRKIKNFAYFILYVLDGRQEDKIF